MKEALFECILSGLNLDPVKRYDILDIGCGKGDLLGRISKFIDPGSSLVGIDAMEESVEHARERYPNIDFQPEKFVDAFSFEDSSFDIVLSVDAMECIVDKSALIGEVARILCPGGLVLFAHWDWDTQVYNSAHKQIVRKLTAEFSDWKQDWMDACDGQMGRRLWGLFEGSGMFTGTIDAFTLLETQYQEGQYGYDRLNDLFGLVRTGTISQEEHDTIRQEMKTLAATKEYFYSVNSYIYRGRPA